LSFRIKAKQKDFFFEKKKQKTFIQSGLSAKSKEEASKC